MLEGVQYISVTNEGTELDVELSLILSSLPKAPCPHTEFLLLKLAKDSLRRYLVSPTHLALLGLSPALQTLSSSSSAISPYPPRLLQPCLRHVQRGNQTRGHCSGGGRHGCRRMLGRALLLANGSGSDTDGPHGRASEGPGPAESRSLPVEPKAKAARRPRRPRSSRGPRPDRKSHV